MLFFFWKKSLLSCCSWTFLILFSSFALVDWYLRFLYPKLTLLFGFFQFLLRVEFEQGHCICLCTGQAGMGLHCRGCLCPAGANCIAVCRGPVCRQRGSRGDRKDNCFPTLTLIPMRVGTMSVFLLLAQRLRVPEMERSLVCGLSMFRREREGRRWSWRAKQGLDYTELCCDKSLSLFSVQLVIFVFN